METLTLEQLSASLRNSLDNGLCAICHQPAVNQFVTHWRSPSGFKPAGFTCCQQECEDTVGQHRDSNGELTI